MKNIALSIYISKITHTLYFIIIYCNNLLLIIAILTLYIIMPNSVFIHNRCLAFSVNIIYIDDIIKHHEKLQSIEFTNFNINTINKTFSNYNQSLSNKDINIKYNHLILLINKLKTSGFINNLQFHLVDNETIKYKIIKITTNNLIKKIIVFRAKKLKIPGSLLSKYFELVV